MKLIKLLCSVSLKSVQISNAILYDSRNVEYKQIEFHAKKIIFAYVIVFDLSKNVAKLIKIYELKNV